MVEDEQLRETLSQTGYATTLPLVADLPDAIEYEPASRSLACATCGRQRRPTFQNLLALIDCHDSLETYDRTDIPPIALDLTLSDSEIEAAPVPARLLCGLQVIYNISQHSYHPCEVDPLHDSLSTCLEQLGVDSQAITTLTNANLLTVHNLGGDSYYTVTPEARDLLNETHQEGTDWGHGEGDITESLLHRVMVDALRRYIDTEFVADPDSPVTSVVTYYGVADGNVDADLDGHTRFDVVGLTDDDTIHVIGEAERKNGDYRTAAIDDYQQIATVEPAEALWLVPSNSKGHDAVLDPLADPPSTDDDGYISSYSTSTRISTITGIDSPGLTEIFTLNDIRKHLDEPTLGSATHG